MAEKIVRPILTYTDEVHHASEGMYQKVLHYFKPDFLLGMTATPDRTDGENIYELFDNDIAYEIRLQQALEFGERYKRRHSRLYFDGKYF